MGTRAQDRGVAHTQPLCRTSPSTVTAVRPVHNLVFLALQPRALGRRELSSPDPDLYMGSGVLCCGPFTHDGASAACQCHRGQQLFHRTNRANHTFSPVRGWDADLFAGLAAAPDAPVHVSCSRRGLPRTPGSPSTETLPTRHTGFCALPRGWPAAGATAKGARNKHTHVHIRGGSYGL